MASCAEDDSSCAVCLTTPRDPRRVPCGNGHAFCLSCLQGLVAHGKTVQDNTFLCPCCRNRVPIPPGGVSAFPPLVESQTRSSPANPPTSPCIKPMSSRQHMHALFRQRPAQADKEGRGFYRPDMLFPGVLLPPGGPHPFFSGRRRPVNNPFYPEGGDRFDLQMDGPESSSHQDNGRHPLYDSVPQRLPKPPFPALYGPHPSMYGDLPYNHTRSYVDRDTEWRKKREDRRLGSGARRREAKSSSDDLDMQEVLLLIAQMEQEEKQAAVHQDRQQQKTFKREPGAASSQKQDLHKQDHHAQDQHGQDHCEQDHYDQDYNERVLYGKDLNSVMSKSQLDLDEKQQLKIAIARSNEDQKEMHNLEMAVVRSKQDQQEQEFADLQTAVIISKQDEQEFADLQMAVVQSKQDQQELGNLHRAVVRSKEDQRVLDL